MARLKVGVLAFGLALLNMEAATAQTMFLQPAPCTSLPCTERRLSVGFGPIRVTGEQPAEAGVPTTYVTPDGRLGVGLHNPASNSSAFVISDLVAGGWFSVGVPDVGGFVGNPTRTELYASDPSGIVVLSPAGLRRLATTTCGPVTGSGRISADGRRIAFSCPSQNSVLVFDTITGDVLGTVPTVLALTPDGAYVYDLSFNPRMLRQVDVSTGLPVAQLALDPAATGVSVAVEPLSGRVVLSEGEFRPVQVLEPDLTFRQFAPHLPTAAWSFDPHRARATAFSAAVIQGGMRTAVNLSVVDTEHWTLLESVSASLPCCISDRPTMAWPPGAPSGLTASVVGAAVSLSWTAPSSAAGVTSMSSPSARRLGSATSSLASTSVHRRPSPPPAFRRASTTSACAPGTTPD
ncbi:MAG: YncE family protein [Vicinamibacterales bacterium]